jgi:hypothetical protein
MRLITLAACLTLTLSLPAQFPIGHATPVGGFAPALFAQPLWLANPVYGYRIQGAPPGGSAIIAISPTRQDQIINGLQAYLDLGNIIITHATTVDAAGRAFLSFPLSAPDDPSLAGLQAYAQAAVSDPATPGSLGTTEAVLLEVTLHPLLAFSTWSGVLWLVDPVAGWMMLVSGLSPTTAIQSMTFANGGRDLFVATSTGVYLVDTFAPAPLAVSITPPVPSQSVAWDRVHRRAYAITFALSTPSIVVVEGDRTSPAFGSIIAQVVNAGESLAVSADGTVLALVSPTGLNRRDADPTSPGYLSIIATPPSPFALGMGTTIDPVQISPDGRVMSVRENNTIANLTKVHRFDAAALAWIDHDPVAPGYQAFAVTAYPALPGLFGLLPTRDGSALVLPASNGVRRVDLDLASPSSITVVTTAAPPAGFFMQYSTLTPEGQFLLRNPSSGFSPPVPVPLSLVEISTGSVTPWVTFPPSPNSPSTAVAAWR